MNLKTALFLTLPALFPLACDEFAAPEVDDDVVAAELDDDAPLVLDLTTPQSSAPLPGQVAQHPAFAQFSQRGWQRIGNILAAKATMTEAELKATYAVFERCRDMSSQVCHDALAAGAFTTPLTATEVQLRNALNASFGLDAMNVPDRTALLRAAQDAYIAGGGAKPPLSLVPTTFEEGQVPCNAACQASVLAGMDLAHGGMLARMSSTNPYESDDGSDDAAAGGFIAILIGVAVAAGEAWIECWIKPDCHTWPEPNDNPPPECNDNGDCDSDEYCWKGPLGIGENECRNKKSNGTKCGNDDACLSGCCNFNLFGSECAQPSKCN